MTHGFLEILYEFRVNFVCIRRRIKQFVSRAVEDAMVREFCFFTFTNEDSSVKMEILPWKMKILALKNDELCDSATPPGGALWTSAGLSSGVAPLTVWPSTSKRSATDGSTQSKRTFRRMWRVRAHGSRSRRCDFLRFALVLHGVLGCLSTYLGLFCRNLRSTVGERSAVLELRSGEFSMEESRFPVGK